MFMKHHSKYVRPASVQTCRTYRLESAWANDLPVMLIERFSECLLGMIIAYQVDYNRAADNGRVCRAAENAKKRN